MDLAFLGRGLGGVEEEAGPVEEEELPLFAAPAATSAFPPAFARPSDAPARFPPPCRAPVFGR